MKAEREQVMIKRKGEMVLWIRMITRFEMEQLISALLVIANRFCTKKMVMQSDWSLQLCYLKYPRNHGIVSAWPHLFDDICVGFCNFTLHAQRIGEVQLFQIRVPQEVLSQWWRVTQTLQGKIQFTLRKAFCKSYVTVFSNPWPLTCKAEFMKQVLPRFVRPHTPGGPWYESSSVEFRLETQHSISIPKNQ